MPTAGTAVRASEKTMKLCFSGQSSNSDKEKSPSERQRSSGMFIHRWILISNNRVCIVSLIALFVFPPQRGRAIKVHLVLGSSTFLFDVDNIKGKISPASHKTLIPFSASIRPAFF